MQKIGETGLQELTLDRHGRAIDPERLLLEEDRVKQLGGGRLGCENLGIAGYHPSLIEFRNIQVHIRPRILDAERNIYPVTKTGPPLKLEVSSVVSPKAYTVQEA